MNKEYRVKKNTEIEAILKEKQSRSTQYFSVYKKVNSETSHFRYAMSVGKKIGNAVTRNKYKRLISAVVSNLNVKLDLNVDVFIIARAKVIELDYNKIYKEIEYLFKKQNLLNQGEKK